jgi:hypothetical protein
MLKLLIIIIVAIIIASILFAVLKKAVKAALFIGLVIVIFIIITSVIYPETSVFQKGKNYILEKSGAILEKGKDKATSYVILESNQTINNVKEKILETFD